MKVDIRKCARCNGDHDDLEFRPFDLPARKFTHWAPCPTNGEPVLMTAKGATLEEQVTTIIVGDLRRNGPMAQLIMATLMKETAEMIAKDLVTNGPIRHAMRNL